MVVNNIDLFKDLKYVIINPHSLPLTILFSFTIVVPVFITIKKTKMLLMRMRNQEITKDALGKSVLGDDFGKPIEIKELSFIAEAINL